MINLAVFSLRDILKYLIKITIVIAVVIGLIRYSSTAKDTISNSIKNVSMISCLDTTIPGIASVNNEGQTKKDFNFLKSTLDIQLGMLTSVTTETNAKADKNNDKEQSNEQSKEKDEAVEKAKTGLKTEVQSSNVPNKYTSQYNGVKIKNETEYKLTKEILTPNITVNKEKILIYHTHTCESYTQSEKYKYKASGNFRTTDRNYSVVRVGRELDKQLQSYGYKVIHNETYHDYPAYTGSYDRSLKTITPILEENKNTDVVIDLHRDAIGDNKYAPTVKIGDEYAAQLMFVIGGNGSSTKHENWQQNLKFAVKVQEKANEMYPGLFKPIILRYSAYNQQAAKAATIIEVGATGNTLDQTLVSMKYLAKVISEVVK